MMLVLSFNEMIDQLTMAKSVHWCGHVLRRMVMCCGEWSCVEEDCHVLRMVMC